MSRRIFTALAATSTIAMMITPAPAQATDLSPTGSAAATSDAADDSLSVGDLIKYTKLKDYTPLHRDFPPYLGDFFSYTTTTKFWSVIAADPTNKMNADIWLNGDKSGQESIDGSWGGKGEANFVAIDSNHMPLGDYYAQVQNWLGKSGSYDVELAQGSQVIDAVPQAIPMLDPSSVIAVRDSLLVAGTSYRFVLAPRSGGMKGSIHLVESEPDDPTSWSRPMGESTRSDVGKPGEAVIIDFTPTRTDRYGIVLMSEGDAGTFDLYRVIF